MQRIEINVKTGEKTVIDLTAEEIADAQARKLIEDAAQAEAKKIITLADVISVLSKEQRDALDVKKAAK